MNTGLNSPFHKKFIKRNSQIILIYAFLIMLIIAAVILDQDFFSVGNFVNLITTSLPLLFVSYAQTLIILTGGIDLSVGATISLTNVICATLMNSSAAGLLAGLLVAIMAGAAAGCANGMIITKGKLQPIIVTLSTSAIIAGIALAVLPAPGGRVHAGFARALTGDIAGIPIPLAIEVIMTVFMWLLLNNTRFGISIYAIGGNENSAFSTGILIDRVKVLAYMTSGLLCALAGIFISAQMYSGDPTVGSNFTLKSITAVVVGGTSLAGGKGGIIGSIAGVYIFVTINNILNLVGIPSFYQYILQGAILITALAIGSLQTRRY